MTASSKNILICPLDWGLGHAARCVPLIRQYALQNHVIIACSERLRFFYKAELPDIETVVLKGKTIKYIKGRHYLAHFIKEMPSMLYSVYREHQDVKKWIKQFQIDELISDNRYGVFSRGVKSVLITHQLRPKAFGKISQFLAQQTAKLLYRRFSEIWVPDIEGPNSYSGELSLRWPHLKIRYIGILSRFQPPENIFSKQPVVLALISGPEPQRTLFEQKVIEEVTRLNQRAIIVRGLPENQQTFDNTPLITYYNHLSTHALAQLICTSQYLVCRSGYSTLMDLEVLQRKALLVSTPHQPEQEYLAQRFAEKFGFQTQIQSALNLSVFKF